MRNRTKILLAIALATLTMTVSTSPASATTANFSSIVGYPTTVSAKGFYSMPSWGLAGFCLSELSGTLPEVSESINLAPTMNNCGSSRTVTFEGCTFTFVAGNLLFFSSEGSMNIVCPSEKEITIVSGECVKKIPPTENLGPVDYTNKENTWEDWVTFKFEVSVKFSQNNKCSGGEGTFEEKLKGSYELRSSNKAVWVT